MSIDGKKSRPRRFALAQLREFGILPHCRMNGIPETQGHTTAVRALVGGASAVVILAGVKLAAEFIIPVILAFFIAVLSYPMMRWMRGRRVPQPVALILTLLVDLSVLVAVGFVAASLFSDFQAKWTDNYQDRIRHSTVHAVSWLEHTLSNAGVEGVREAFNSMINIDALLKLATDNVGGVVTGLTSVVKLTLLILLLVGFMLADAGNFARKLPMVHGVGGPDFCGWARVATDIQKYLGIKTLTSVLTGFAAWGLCQFFGLDFAILWGLVAFAFNYIPAVGSIIAAVPPVMLALVQLGWTQMLGVGIGYLAINMILGNIIEPTLQGKRFGISVVVVLLSVLFWGWLLGLAGMFLAVPLTMLVKVALSTSPELRWIPALIETDKSLGPMAQAIVEKVKGSDPEKSQPDAESGATTGETGPTPP